MYYDFEQDPNEGIGLAVMIISFGAFLAAAAFLYARGRGWI
jgi:hypothetical protein